jgi:glycosyltransferase involved in cell wall biosynthesis
MSASEDSDAAPGATMAAPPSSTHLVLIPSYNPGNKVFETVRAARAHWNPVWVIVDGSTDGTAEGLEARARQDPGLRIFVNRRNGGKGAAVLQGLREAQRAGFTHVLTMDSDAQHPAERIASFMAASRAEPAAMVLGEPVFDASAPRLRVRGRKLSNWWTNVENLGAGIHDSLDAALRLRCRDRRAAQLERCQSDQSTRCRALLLSRRRRRLAFQLLAG